VEGCAPVDLMDLFILMGLPLVPKAEEKISMYEPGTLSVPQAWHGILVASIDPLPNPGNG